MPAISSSNTYKKVRTPSLHGSPYRLSFSSPLCTQLYWAVVNLELTCCHSHLLGSFLAVSPGSCPRMEYNVICTNPINRHPDSHPKLPERENNHLKRLRQSIKHSQIRTALNICLPQNENESRFEMARKTKRKSLSTHQKNISTTLPVHFRRSLRIYI